MKNTTYTYYQDPGHGWMAVEVDDLIELNILTDISGCSYRKGDTVYLEEDCDMSEFFHAYEKRYGKTPKTTSENDAEWIRDLPYFDAKVYLKRLYVCANNLDAEIDGSRDDNYIGQLVNCSRDLWDMINKIEKSD